MQLRTNIKKEILDGIRNYRFFAITATYLFFAILNPLMNRFFLPELLKNQFPNMTEELLLDMLQATQLASVRGYIGSVSELGLIITIFVLCGTMAQEINDRTMLISATSGKRYRDIVLGKIIVYGMALMVISTFSITVNYLYSGVLFGFEMPSILPVIRAGLLQGLYLVFILTLLILVGSLIKKPIPTALLVLIPGFFLGYLGSLFNINSYLPSGLVEEALQMSLVPSATLFQSVISTLAILVLCVGFTVVRLSKMELTRG